MGDKVKQNNIAETHSQSAIENGGTIETSQNIPKLSYIHYSDAINTVFDELFEIEANKILTKDQLRAVLNSVFQGDLSMIPIYLEKLVVLTGIRIRIYCEICSIQITLFNSVETSAEGIRKHFNGIKHKKNHEALGQNFTTTKSNFDLSEAISLPDDMFSSLFSADVADHKKYFKACLHLFFNCRLCKHIIGPYNKLQPIQRSIYNHIYENQHISRYVKMFKKSGYERVCSKDVLKATIDSIFEEAKPFVPKELYLELLNNIYKDSLEKIPEHSEKYISIKLDLTINCNLCMCQILKSNYKDITNQARHHFFGKNHHRLFKSLKSSGGDLKRCDMYAEVIINPDNMVKVPENVLCSLFSGINCIEYDRRLVSANFVFDVKCNICDVFRVKTSNVINLRADIKSHIDSKRHRKQALALIPRFVSE